MRPKFDQSLLPHNYKVKYKIFNVDGARRIIIAAVVSPTNKALSTGHAICSPQDEYIEERGMLIAEGRAIKSWWIRETIMSNTIQQKIDDHMYHTLKGEPNAIRQTES